jgi:hypothetical protein
MAEKKIIEIEVKTQDAVKSMDALSKSTKEAGKEFDKAATFAERYGEELQPLTARMGEAEDRLYELANAGQTTTQEYKDLLKSVGDFRKVQISTDMAVDAAATTMGQKLGGALGGVTSGFSLAQGAFAAFGSESKEVEQALLKVQAAMAIQQGIQGIREAIPAIRALATEIRAVVSATGIGLIVVSLGLVYTYWEDISKAIGFAGGETEKYAKQQKAIGEEAKKQSEEVAKESGAFATLISRLKTTNQNTKEREELIKKINLQYGTTLKNIKDERDFQEQLNTELASYLEYQKAKYSLQKNEDLIVKNLEKQDRIKREILNTEKELKKEALKILEIEEGAGVKFDEKTDTYIPKIKNQLKSLRSELKEAEKQFENYGEAAQNAAIKVDILTDSGTKYVEQIVNDAPKITETLNQFKQDVDNLNEEIRVSKLTDEEKEIDALNKKYDKVIEEGKKHGVNVKALEEEKRLALAAITKKYDNEDSSIRLTNSQSVISNIVSEGTKRLEAEKAIGDKSREQLKEDLDKQKALRERNLKFIIESMTQILSITQDLATMNENKYKEINDKVLANENLTTEQKQKAIIKNNANAKKSFELNKKFQIASTLISTFATARDAYKSQFVPPDGSSPIRGAVAAGIATAGGLIAVKKIMSTQFQGTSIPSGGDGGGATVPTMSAPQFNVVGQSGVNQLASLNQQPIQAYVVSGQVTSQQALDRNRLANATLGG